MGKRSMVPLDRKINQQPAPARVHFVNPTKCWSSENIDNNHFRFKAAGQVRLTQKPGLEEKLRRKNW